jgi:hypothetical protein
MGAAKKIFWGAMALTVLFQGTVFAACNYMDKHPQTRAVHAQPPRIVEPHRPKVVWIPVKNIPARHKANHHVAKAARHISPRTLSAHKKHGVRHYAHHRVLPSGQRDDRKVSLHDPRYSEGDYLSQILARKKHRKA